MIFFRNINCFVFVGDIDFVLCEGGAEFLNIVYITSGFKYLRNFYLGLFFNARS
jgi:hypothetical protein